MNISDKEIFEEVEVHVQSTKEAAKRSKLPESTIRNALDEIAAGSSIYAASKKFSVPRSTLSNRNRDNRISKEGGTSENAIGK